MTLAARLPALQQTLREAGLDGWLLYEWQGQNPVANALLQLGSHVTRRAFAWIPADGTPVALAHAIERHLWRRWPAEWETRVYSGWAELEATLASLVGGRTVAMEYSPGNAVPYVDRIPAGVLEMVRAAGATVTSSAALVTRFAAALDDDALAGHARAAEAIAAIADAAMRRAAAHAHAGTPLTEFALQQWILGEFVARGLETEHAPIIAVDGNAANPHYAPSPTRAATIGTGCVLLVDLWAREPGGVFADQTWMATIGAPPAGFAEAWAAVRDGRDAAIARVREAMATGTAPTGASLDAAARDVIVARGFGEHFVHRTGHSIDRTGLHGAGPHLDSVETREERRLMPGVLFSVEPGIYLPGRFGIRSEVNMFVAADGTVQVTPSTYQREALAL
jgi:Xaa-Pro aminopeptidase